MATVLVYGVAMQSSGLAQRVSLHILTVFPGNYRGVLTSFLVIGTFLAFGVPSITVRTAIMVPVAWAVVEAIGLRPRSAGAALIVLTSIEMAVFPGCAFLTGSLYGPLIESLFRSRGFEVSWLGYAQVMAFPMLLLSALIVVVNPLVVRPNAPLQIAPHFARDRLAALGPITRREWLTAVVVVVSTIYWATGELHQLPAPLVGIPALGMLIAAGVVRRREVARFPWILLLFLGTLFSVVKLLEELNVSQWVADSLSFIVGPITSSPLLATLAAAAAMFAVKFVDPSGFVALSVLFLPLSELTREGSLPPMILLSALLLASGPFWVSYQNIWMIIGEGITGQQAFTAAQRIRLAHTYAALAVVTLVVSVGFWRAVGWL